MDPESYLLILESIPSLALYFIFIFYWCSCLSSPTDQLQLSEREPGFNLDHVSSTKELSKFQVQTQIGPSAASVQWSTTSPPLDF